MENRKDIFNYTYSAKQQEEIQSIRSKYLPQEQKIDKMEQLRRLDKSTTKRGTIISIATGILGCLLLGVGHMLHYGVDGKVVSSRSHYWNRGDCSYRYSLSAVYPYHQKGTGKGSASDFKADRGAGKTGIKTFSAITT